MTLNDRCDELATNRIATRKNPYTRLRSALQIDGLVVDFAFTTSNAQDARHQLTKSHS
ncbi:hypothetical protein DENSPDRAFT_831855 [Dentipellis sp. KUC8613]|nr:hypothetical protein DENSPDRAFT_831855 [Dentipellis sp. KUC8613]